jgi:hypothetical protein
VLFRLADNHRVHVPNKESKVLMYKYTGLTDLKTVLFKAIEVRSNYSI